MLCEIFGYLVSRLNILQPSDSASQDHVSRNDRMDTSLLQGKSDPVQPLYYQLVGNPSQRMVLL